MKATKPIVCALALALAGPAQAAEPGSGAFQVFRSLDLDQPAAPEDDARCDRHFGPRAATVVKRLDAALHAVEVNPLSGRVTDQVARWLGPGYLCAAPSAAEPSALDVYAHTTLPASGFAESPGSCRLQPVLSAPGAAFLHCVVTVVPDPDRNVVGGLATSNSIVRLGGITDVATGSIWTAFVVGGSPTVPDDSRRGTPAPSGGVDFLILRSGPSWREGGCADGRGLTADLQAAGVDIATGALDGNGRPAIGRLELCVAPSGGPASGTVTVPARDGTARLTAEGSCRLHPAPGAPASRLRVCALTLPEQQQGGGLIVGSDLVAEDGSPSAAAGVWTASLLDAPADVVSSTDAAPPRVRIRARRLSDRRVRLRWRATDEGSGVASYDLRVRRGGHWRRPARWQRTRRRAITLATASRVRVGVRATDRAGNRSVWVTRTVPGRR